jgi:hypothetical protein
MLDMIFDRAEREQVNPLVAAERVARERLATRRAGGGGR